MAELCATMEAKDPPPIVEDPNLAAQQAQAQRSLVTNLQNEATLDTASIMARFGTTQALIGAGMAQPTAPATPPVRF